MNTELAKRYIKAKFKGATSDELSVLKKDIADELKVIRSEKSDVFARFPGIHGRFQQSQLDVLDIRERKICALFDNVDEMLLTVAQ